MMKRVFQKSVILFVIYCFTQINSFGQGQSYEGLVNIIPTAVPFLSIAPDSRSGGMGGVGVALSPDFNSQFWNPAKYAFIEKDFGVGLGFTPWLRQLVDDINLFSLSGFYRLDDMQGISASLRYFSIGSILIRESAEDQGYPVQPNEFAIDLAYNRVLSDYFSGSVAFRYIRSDLNSGINTDEAAQAGNSFAADVSFYYHSPINLFSQDSEISAGINVSNIGNKISYDGGTTREFIPTNLGLGVAVATEMDSYNAITFSLDANKLLVPTPGITGENEDYNDYRQRYNEMGTLKGMFQSFSDAPNGFKEELQEITLNFGAEYWYDKQFAIRAGYYHEHKLKGNRKHFTAGIGLKFNILTLDASYIIAVNQNNPLANTIRFSLGVDIK